MAAKDPLFRQCFQHFPSMLLGAHLREDPFNQAVAANHKGTPDNALVAFTVHLFTPQVPKAFMTLLSGSASNMKGKLNFADNFYEILEYPPLIPTTATPRSAKSL